MARIGYLRPYFREVLEGAPDSSHTPRAPRCENNQNRLSEIDYPDIMLQTGLCDIVPKRANGLNGTSSSKKTPAIGVFLCLGSTGMGPRPERVEHL